MPATTPISIATTTPPAPAARAPKPVAGPSRFENELNRAQPEQRAPATSNQRSKAPDLARAAAPEPAAKAAKDRKAKASATNASPAPADGGLMIDAPAESSSAPDAAPGEPEADSTKAVVGAADFISVTYPAQPAPTDDASETQTISNAQSSATQPAVQPQAAADLLAPPEQAETLETEQNRATTSIAEVPQPQAQVDETADDTQPRIILGESEVPTESPAMEGDDAASLTAASPRPAVPSSDVEQPALAGPPIEASDDPPGSASTPRIASLPVSHDSVETQDAPENREPVPTAGSADKGRQAEPDHLQVPAPAHVKADATLNAQADRPAAPQPQTPPRTPEQQFIDDNHPQIVTSIRSQPLPNGSSMRIRLDPPELGTMQVQIEMRDGMLAASFQTSTDDATRLLTHSLHQLKQALELQGVNVDKLQVEQTPREKFAPSSHDQQQQQHEDGRSPQQQQHEQQRREILQRLWRRIRGGREPFDELA